jgi:hypothetical protein
MRFLVNLLLQPPPFNKRPRWTPKAGLVDTWAVCVCACVCVCVCVRACVRACVRVLWQVDPEGGRNPMRRCMHVNLIKSSNLGHEREFLFAPYSVFTVRRSLFMCI